MSVYVSHTGSNTAPYDLWSKATPSLNLAVDQANLVGGSIIIEDGTYVLSGPLVLQNQVYIYSKNNDPSKVIVSGDNLYRCFDIGANCCVYNITIANGRTSGNGAGCYVRQYGVIGNCRITGCVATGNGGSGLGGGLYVDNGASWTNDEYGTYPNYNIDGCTIDNCTALHGGGVFSVTGILTNCTISNCSVNTTSGNGGGVYVGATIAGADESSSSSMSSHSSKSQSSVSSGSSYSSSSISPSSYSSFSSSSISSASSLSSSSSSISSVSSLNSSSSSSSQSSLSSLSSLNSDSSSSSSSTDVGFVTFLPLLSSCVVSGCSAHNGGGIYLNIANGSIYRCTVTNCTASPTNGYAGGIYMNYVGSGSVIASHCTLTGNSGRSGGGAYGQGISNLVMSTSLLHHNSGTFGGGAYQLYMTNCTVCNNVATSTGGGTYGSTIKNSIAYFNTCPNGPNTYGGALSYCCTPEGTGTAPVSGDPSFVNISALNYRLKVGSPCVNAGNNAYIAGYLDQYDLDGNPRSVGHRIDIGAYELQTADSSSSSHSSVSSVSSVNSSSSSSSQSSISSQSSSSANSSSSSFSSGSSLSAQSQSSDSSSMSSSSSQSSSSTHADEIVFGPAESSFAHPSLVIDIVNREDLISETKAAFGSEFSSQLGWVSEERLRGDFSVGSARWGFKHANGQVSNAVVFSGETVAIHFATKGHGVGYLSSAGNQPVFSKTVVRVTLLDLMRGAEKSVTFDGFSKPIDDPSRYLMWEVGGTDGFSQHARSSNGMCGMFVLCVSEESQLYAKADWTKEISIDDGMMLQKNESRMQVLAYDWRDALGNIALSPSRNVGMMSGVEFRTQPIDQNTSENEFDVFDNKTKFPTFELGVGLNDEQKVVVIRDNAMVLLSSQGPILPADAHQAPILGIGMTAAVLPSTRGPVVSTRPAEALPIAIQDSRTFSLTGRPATTNVLSDMGDFASEHGQGNFAFPNPIRMLAFGEGGEKSSGFDEGMSWALCGASSNGVFIPPGYENQFELLIGDVGRELNTVGDYESSSSSSSMLKSTSSLSSKSSSSSSSSSNSSSSNSSNSSRSSKSSKSSQSISSKSSSSSSKSSSSRSSESSSSSSLSSISSKSSNFIGSFTVSGGSDDGATIALNGVTLYTIYSSGTGPSYSVQNNDIISIYNYDYGSGTCWNAGSWTANVVMTGTHWSAAYSSSYSYCPSLYDPPRGGPATPPWTGGGEYPALLTQIQIIDGVPTFIGANRFNGTQSVTMV